MISLNLGCGKDYRRGFVNIDKNKNHRPDVICLAEELPFKNNIFSFVLANHIFEHVDLNKVIPELVRVCKNGAIIKGVSPYAKSDGFLQDPEHRTPITRNTFNYFQNIRVVEFKEIAKGKNKLIPFKRILKVFLFNVYLEVEFKLSVEK